MCNKNIEKDMVLAAIFCFVYFKLNDTKDSIELVNSG